MDKTTVLIVDDELELIEPLKMNLETHGYEVHTAVSGEEAFALCLKHSIDAIVTDVRMSGEGGLDLLRKIKERDPVKPIVTFISAYSDFPSSQAYHRGVNASLRKPFEVEELCQRIEWGLRSAEERWSDRAAKHAKVITNPEEVTIGRGGLSFRASLEGIVIGDLIGFELVDNTLGELKGQGVVRWCDRDLSAVGLEFSYLEPESLKKVSEFIDELRSVPYIPLLNPQWPEE